ncbi:alpha-amylase, partial [Pseudoalteromonas sp. SG41-5]
MTTNKTTISTFKYGSWVLASSLLLSSCSDEPTTPSTDKKVAEQVNEHSKPVVYQVFTRLFGNTQTANIPWGTKEQNGVGTFSDFNDTALSGIKELGTTHIWYTGVLHHALVGDYSQYGISQDDPDVVKGRAGSPYAIKDYYDVNPDLAINPERRLEEFAALIERTHRHGMKVVIDIVPNHVARHYQSTAKPAGVKDFGEQDDTSVEYARDNNFYYVTGQSFQVPTSENYQVLGGNAHPLADNLFAETPAKWTGNGARAAKPDINDWYETVKVNYGVKPDGSYDFPTLPDEYATKDLRAHFEFWQDKELPNSWYKFRDIALYWLDKGVDGFRYDMAEMVPVEFWSFLNSSIKMHNPEAFLLAEVYNPALYRPYIQQGKMDYLYDKVGFYDTLKAVMQGTQPADTIFNAQQKVADIEQHML